MASTLFYKKLRWILQLIIVLGYHIPLEAIRSVLLFPTGSRFYGKKSWSWFTNLKVRIVRRSLGQAMQLQTWDTFDWHMAPLLHSKSLRIQVPRYAAFDAADLFSDAAAKSYAGSVQGLTSEIKPEDRTGTFEGLWFHPKDRSVNKEKVFLYCHGGAYKVCLHDGPFYYDMYKRFTREFGISLFTIDYRASEEHPFPYCLQDVVSAYIYLTKACGYKPENIILAGDSAGGNLALVSLLYLATRGTSDPYLYPPGRAMLISPWGDMTMSKLSDPRTQAAFNSDYIVESMGLEGGKQQTRGAPRTSHAHPYLSPCNADWTPFKTWLEENNRSFSVHVNYGGGEVLRLDIEEVIENLKTQLGAERVVVDFLPDCPHEIQHVLPEMPQALQAYASQKKWLASSA